MQDDTPQRPNVLLIMTDQHRGDCLGCAGHPCVETPNLDMLASRGVYFRNAYTACPSCIPARAIMMTGMNQWKTGILGMGAGQKHMPGDFRHTLAGTLAQAGYHTCAVGKMHVHPQRALYGFHQTVLDESGREETPAFTSDYRRWFREKSGGVYDIVDHGVAWNSWMARPYHAPEWLHPTNWTVNESLAFLERRDPTKPFFLFTSFARPHSPYDAVPAFWNMYEKKDINEPVIGEWAAMHDDPVTAKDVNAWRGRQSEEAIRRARVGYYAQVNHIDSQIGRLLNVMQRGRLLDNTIVLFTSDHGDMLGDHNLWRKTYAYEGSARIPFVAAFPRRFGIQGNQVRDEPLELMDVMPTLLDACGVSIPDTVDGRSIMPLVRGEVNDWREFVHGEHCRCYSPANEMQYVTDGKRKFIWFPQLGTEQFFDLEEDRDECCDLATVPERADEVTEWRGRLASVLVERDLGLVEDGQLVCQKDQPPIVSPNYGTY